ncbi:MAG: hypothetical protein ABJA77_16465 [Variovorax sp.]
MSKRSDEIETVPHCLDDGPPAPKAPAATPTFASTVANFFRLKGDEDAPEAMMAQVLPIRHASEASRLAPTPLNSTLYKHWESIQAEGITASQFIAFLQPLADLGGIAVSYIYSDDDGMEQAYHHRGGELGAVNPLSRAIQERKLSKEKALTFALNEEGRVWIESNFIDLNDLQ